MSQTIRIADDLYGRLEESARQRGLETVEQLIEAWQSAEEELLRGPDALRPMDVISGRMFETYRELAESGYWVRQDTDRAL